MPPTELSPLLKALYRHWNAHTIPTKGNLYSEEIFRDNKLFERIDWFIKERMNIWNKKTNEEKPPLTEDPVMSAYKFCNIFRELDRQTIVFHSLLNPLRDDFPIWLLNMFYCRMVARPETIEYTGLLSFDIRHNEDVYERLMGSPRPRYGTPYVFPISTIQRGPNPTRELFIARHLPKVMQEVAKEIKSWKGLSVYDGVKKILPIFKYELRFHWTEILIDTAYQFPEFIDLFARFPTGPGAIPTLNRINPTKDPSILAVDLSRLDIDARLRYEGKVVRLSAENWEGIACEFRKYTNLSNGTGRRRLYKNGNFPPPQTNTLF